MINLWTNVYFLVIAVGLSSALGDALINIYVKTNHLGWFLLGCLGWCTAAVFWSQILRQQSFAPSAALFFIGNITVAALIGYFYFGDRVSLFQWIGVVVGVIAMILIIRGGN
jgi:drug/metabolite transporter (DMT)-like permease